MISGYNHLLTNQAEWFSKVDEPLVIDEMLTG